MMQQVGSTQLNNDGASTRMHGYIMSPNGDDDEWTADFLA